MKIQKLKFKVPVPGIYKSVIGTGTLNGFTLVELIVVISIITLISSSGVFYFLDYVQQQKINQKLILVEDDIDKLDKQIKKYDIFDYEMIFSTSSTGSTSYITYINKFDSKNQFLNITNNSGSGIITSNGSGTGVIKIYKNKKLFLLKKIDRDLGYPFNFNEVQNYKITGKQDTDILNDIYLKYYSEDNLYPEKNDILKLIKISETKTLPNLSNITITNIGGKKIIRDSTNKYNQIYLLFENNGKQDYIKIEK